MGAVDEVPELGLPQHQGAAVLVGVAVLEAQRGVLAEQAVVDPEVGRLGRKGGQRDPDLLVLEVGERSVPLAERAPTGVLACQAHRRALDDQRAERQQLRRGPVDLTLLVVHLRPGLELADQLWVGVEVRRIGGEVVEDAVERVAGYTGVGMRTHPHRRWRLGHLHRVGHLGACLVEGSLQLGVEVRQRPLGLLHGDVAPLHQRLHVELAHTATLGDGPVHEGLGVARVVALVVSVAAVADEVDDDVLVELLAVLERQLRHAHARLGIVAVDVEDGGLHRLGDIAAIERAARVLGTGGEADLIVDDQVDGATDAVAGDVAHRQALGHHSLSGESRVAVDEDRQRWERAGRVDRVLDGTHHAEHDRADGLEVARVCRQFEPDGFTVGAVVATRRPEVVLDVA